MYSLIFLARRDTGAFIGEIYSFFRFRYFGIRNILFLKRFIFRNNYQCDPWNSSSFNVISPASLPRINRIFQNNEWQTPTEITSGIRRRIYVHHCIIRDLSAIGRYIKLLLGIVLFADGHGHCLFCLYGICTLTEHRKHTIRKFESFFICIHSYHPYIIMFSER